MKTGNSMKFQWKFNGKNPVISVRETGRGTKILDVVCDNDLQYKVYNFRIDCPKQSYTTAEYLSMTLTMTPSHDKS